ncbi:GNAT family N-acetyltransferase [Rubrivivax albus]|uniref:GNAT family N-acetyltransferase n=1 Tax=Rubrivivax albus TaxID=2499835 RepID=A0A437JL40_9BURK|nr:GNAT family N-acetyltransferase [Rubrivivax albus]
MLTHLRNATIEDKARILALMEGVIHDTVDASHQLETIENVASNLGLWERAPERCVHLVAEFDREVVGVVLVKDFWNLCSLFVATEHHRKGIGRALLLAAIDRCRGSSPKEAIHLNSSAFAVQFYLSLGFEHRQSSQQLPPGFMPLRYALAASEA